MSIGQMKKSHQAGLGCKNERDSDLVPLRAFWTRYLAIVSSTGIAPSTWPACQPGFLEGNPREEKVGS